MDTSKNKNEEKTALNGLPLPQGSEVPNPAPDATAPAAIDAAPKPANVQRSVAALPNRAPDNTWNAISGVCFGLLQTRGYKRADDVRKALEQLRPVGRHALTMHALEGGSINFSTGDLQLDIEVVYGVVDVGEDLTLPAVANALGVLPQETICSLTLFLTSPLQDATMERILAEINAADALSVSWELIERQIEDQNPTPTGDDNSTSQEENHNGSH